MQSLAAIVVGNLPCYFAYPLLDLVGGDHNPQLVGLGALTHSSPEGLSLIARAFSTPPRMRKRPGTGNPRTHTTSAPCTTTGQSFLSDPVMCNSCSNSLIFFGDLVWAGQKRSPARQFRTRSSLPNSVESSKWSGLYPPPTRTETSAASNHVPVSATLIRPGTGRQHSSSYFAS